MSDNLQDELSWLWGSKVWEEPDDTSTSDTEDEEEGGDDDN